MKDKLEKLKTNFFKSSKNFIMNDTYGEKVSFCVLLALLAVLTIFNYVYNLAYITSDTIANIRYIQCVWESHSIFPDYWTGSTGLMLPTLIPGLPIYAITRDLVITHAAVNITNQYMVIIVFYYMLKSFGFRKTEIHYACIITVISLVCATQASLVMISYTVYSPFYIVALISLGFTNKLRKEVTVRFKKGKVVLLFITAFILGLSTPQFFMMVFGPLIAYNIYYLIKKTTKKECLLTAMSVALFFLSFVAYYLSLKIIMPSVGIPGMWSATMVANASDFAENILHELDIMYYIFSYVGGTDLFSKQGIYSLLILLYCIVFIVSLIWVLKRSKVDDKGIIIYFGMSVTFVYFYLSFIVMPFTLRYFSFLPLLMALTVVIAIRGIEKTLLKTILKITSIICFLMIFIIFSFCHINENNEKNRQVDNLKKVSAYLQDESCDTAFATFWNANRLTGVTDGTIKTGSINIDFSIFNWLLDKRVFWNENDDRVTAIILTDSELEMMKEQNGGALNSKLNFAIKVNKIENCNIFLFNEIPIQMFEIPSTQGAFEINKIGKTMFLRNGEYDSNYNYTVEGQGDYSMYGPYMVINEGTYRFELSYDIINDNNTGSIGIFDITENSGSVICAKAEIDSEKKSLVIDNVEFNHSHEVEFRVMINNENTVTLKDIIVTRVK